MWDPCHTTSETLNISHGVCGTNDIPHDQILNISHLCVAPMTHRRSKNSIFFVIFRQICLKIAHIHIKSPKFLHFLIKIRNSLWDPCHTTSEILNILYLRVGPMTHHSKKFLNCRACVWDPCHTTQAPIGLCGRFVWCVWHHK